MCVCERIIAICICAGDSDVANNYAFCKTGSGTAAADGEDKKKKLYIRLTRERYLSAVTFFFPHLFLRIPDLRHTAYIHILHTPQRWCESENNNNYYLVGYVRTIYYFGDGKLY